MKNFTKAKLLFSVFLYFAGFSVNAEIITGAERGNEYLPLLKDKKIALVINQTSMVGEQHLLDYLISKDIKPKKIFAPEHGFRGDAGAGQKIADDKDKRTGIPVISLYGKNFKPSPAELKNIDIMVFDIQDVGARFYTYISTLHYVMEACAQNKKPLIILDRPNPNGFYIDGPVLQPEFKSFVGMHPVPIVHGMTIGEYAQMINGEGWLEGGIKCSLSIIKMDGYNHDMPYNLPAPPSPNQPTIESIYLYPSLCLFEGTDVSVGRGTDTPFELVGRPDFTEGSTNFTPVSIPGKAEHPLYEGKECEGFKLTKFADEYIKFSKQIYLYWLLGFYEKSKNKEHFFSPFFDKLAGTDQLRKQIIQGLSPDQIHDSWEDGLNKFKTVRAKYLLYPDFTKDDRDVKVREH
jgi:uncharacterized protein YbbC (DUF1343 family)